MFPEEVTARRLVLLATAVTVVALVILFIDTGIKRAIIAEARELRTYVSTASQPPAPRVARPVKRPPDKVPDQMPHTPGGGIRRAGFITEPPVRSRQLTHGEEEGELCRSGEPLMRGT